MSGRPSSSKTILALPSAWPKEWRSIRRSPTPVVYSWRAPIRPATVRSSLAGPTSARLSFSTRAASLLSRRSGLGLLNGAIYLEVEDQVGSLAPGKLADLIVLDGDPSADITAVRNVHIVFKDGIGYDPAKLIEAAKGGGRTLLNLIESGACWTGE